MTKSEDRNGPDAIDDEARPGAPDDEAGNPRAEGVAQDLDSLAESGADSDAMVEQLEAELDTARTELGRTMDQMRRLAADFDNYRKRIDRERVETSTRAQAEVVLRLLEVVDDLERVTVHADDASRPLLEGVQLVERKLMQVLSSLGLEKIEAEGATFDPTMMEGLATVPAETPEEDDRVAMVFQPGYLFKGQVLRPARVSVKQHEA